MDVIQDGSEQRGTVTIKTVAKLAGVSISTVSRVLNNPESVTEDKRLRVNRAIEELRYVPNPVARALGSRKVGSIAIVVPTILNPLMNEAMRGIIEVLDEGCYDAIVFDSNEDFTREQTFYELLPHKMVEGAIFLASAGRELDFDALAEKMPVALISRPETPTKVDTFVSDERHGMRLLTEHLAALGHKEIGHIGGAFGNSSAMLRFDYFRDALDHMRLPWHPEYNTFCDWSIHGGYEAMLRLVKRTHRPSAIICSTDLIALGAMAGARELGIRIPEELSVTGFDNAPSSPFIYPSLTTLKYPNYRLGRLAARAVLRRLRLKDRRIIRKVIPLELIQRNSTTELHIGPCPPAGGE